MPDPIVLTLRDQKFELPNGVPFRALKLLTVSGDLGKMEEGISKILGDDAEAFWDMEPSVPETVDFLRQISDALGFEDSEENPTASPGSSTSTGRLSKPISNDSTDSD